MNRLLEIGFQAAGHWLLNGDSLVLELLRHSSQKNILYAFVSDGEVKYVGKTTRSLAVRLAGYRTPSSSQITNLRNHHRIKELLAAGAVVEILALPDNGHLRYGQFHLNLAAGLEDDIIRIVAPEWNGGLTERGTAAKSDNEGGSSEIRPAIGSFSFTLQPTYYRTGFFNVGVADEHHIGSDGETIDIYLGDGEEPIRGTINRRGNLNGTPRIMGGAALRDWFQAVADIKEAIHVDVLSPTELRLRSEASGACSS